MSTVQITSELGAEATIEDNIVEQDMSMDDHLDDLDVAMESLEVIQRIRSLRKDKEISPISRKLSNIAIGSAISRVPSCESIIANFSSNKDYDANLTMATESIVDSIVDKIKSVFSSTDQKSGELVQEVKELYTYQQTALKELGELGKQLEANHSELDKHEPVNLNKETIANFGYLSHIVKKQEIPFEYVVNDIEFALAEGSTVNGLLNSCYLMLSDISDTAKQIMSQKEPDERKIIDLIWESAKDVNANIDSDWRHDDYPKVNGKLDSEYSAKRFPNFCKGIKVSAYKLENDKIYSIVVSDKVNVETESVIPYGDVKDVAELTAVVKDANYTKYASEIKKHLTYIENVSSKFSSTMPGILKQIKDEFALQEFTKFIKQVQEFTAQSLKVAELWLYEYKVAVDLLELHVEYYKGLLAQMQSDKPE